MKGTQSHKEPSDRDSIAELFQHASARERPPTADELAQATRELAEAIQ